ncbi:MULTISPECIES: LptA/OstA family protein [Kosmotoga]|jgi:lipopolysaccharide export system protein LptA|uniref:OstA family protein n=1 Tax=Kosmotoga olearia (strain ATCC BAA-1733 / DSM 21960 / TBF 19.5.1) TaxID=521045 RepID=C5CGC4_KOSOT|nr:MULTISPECIES: LptA/OstA family protein [Kosmotoga]ACR79565.1 OstA family protein [Kosmotoga olearia TBF 19.5.1]MDI3523921.1 hypothetical protein [Kosmotoga sp.]MDK2953300.1 hypothetical protein [Kosmotoga sp.]OAA22115.1 hypothetical protein DU53_04520 [Kosmotoga sp. DU53]
MKKNIIVLVVFLLLVSLLIAAGTVKIRAKNIVGSKDQVYLTGDVYIEKEGEVSVETDEATLLAKKGNWNYIVAEGSTYALFSTGEATATFLEYNMDTSSGVMKGDVIASLKDDKGKQKLLVKNAAELDFNLDTEEFIGETLSKKDPAFKPVLIYYRDELEARALYFEYHGKKGIFYLKGDVYIVDKKNNRTITASELTYNTTNDTFEGKDVYLEIILEEGEQ